MRALIINELRLGERCPTLAQLASYRDQSSRHIAMSKPLVDRLDLRILSALSKQGRETITDLSKHVGLSPTPCSTRMESLEASGIILGYRAEIDIERLANMSLYSVTFALKIWTPNLARTVESLIQECPYVIYCDSVFGSLDYVMWVYARSIEHYHSILEPFRAYEIDYTTHPVSKRVVRLRLQPLLAELAKHSG